MIGRIIDRCHPVAIGRRVPIEIAPDVRDRLRMLLYRPEFKGVGYSAFINRCCELAETEIAEQQRELSAANDHERRADVCR